MISIVENIGCLKLAGALSSVLKLIKHSIAHFEGSYPNSWMRIWSGLENFFQVQIHALAIAKMFRYLLSSADAQKQSHAINTSKQF